MWRDVRLHPYMADGKYVALLNDVDVSSSAVGIDTVDGWVELHTGHDDHGNMCTKRVYGNVKLMVRR